MRYYNLPDASVLLGHEPFTLAHTYTRQTTHRWSEQVEIEPEQIIPAVAEVTDPETGEITTPAQPEQIIPARYETRHHVDDVSEEVTEPVRYPGGWLASASQEALAALGITVEDVPEPLPSLSEAQAERIAAAWSECSRRVEAGVVSVATSAGTHSYGTDSGTQDNISKALLGVLGGLTPNPRPWTPKGSTVPISLTHDDIKLIAGAIGLAYDSHVQAYLVHKGAILAMTDVTAVMAYDIASGWPGV